MEDKIFYYLFIVIALVAICFYRIKYGGFNDITFIIGLVLVGFIISNMHIFNVIGGVDNIENFADTEAIKNIASVYNNGKLIVKDLEVTGNATIKGALTVTGGSNFSGGRNYFEDEEKAGRLRVGGAWGMPGIYAEDGKNIVIGGSGGKAIIKDTEFHAEKGSRFTNGRHLFNDSENAGWLRVGGAWGKPGIHAEDGKEIIVAGGSGTNTIHLKGNAKMNDKDIVTTDQTLSVRPNNKADRCFDFGSKGHVWCDNGWAHMKIHKH